MPAVAQMKRVKKSRERNIPDEVERAIEVTFDCGQQPPQRREGALKHHRLAGEGVRHCAVESTKVSIKNRDFRLWKTVCNLLTALLDGEQTANSLAAIGIAGSAAV